MYSLRMSRAEMVRKLVAYSVQAALTEGKHHYWLSELFEKGFTGYGNFTDRQLLLEMQLRGLVQLEDDSGDDMIEELDEGSDDLDSLSEFSLEKEDIE